MGVPNGFRTLDPFSGSFSDIGSPSATYEVRWVFNTDGTGDEIRAQDADNLGLELIFPAAKTSQTWVRCSEDSGLTLTTGTPATWQQISSTRTFAIARSLTESSYQVTFELATDSGGTDIVASKTISGSVGKIL